MTFSQNSMEIYLIFSPSGKRITAISFVKISKYIKTGLNCINYGDLRFLKREIIKL